MDGGSHGVAGERRQVECLCCCCEVEVDVILVCAKGHHVCAACQRKTRAQACFYCMPLPIVEVEIQPPSQIESRERCEPCVRETVVYLLHAVSCFFILVYAGKIFVWFYSITQDREVEWLSWGSFWHAPAEFLIGLLGLTVFAGCCVRND